MKTPFLLLAGAVIGSVATIVAAAVLFKDTILAMPDDGLMFDDEDEVH